MKKLVRIDGNTGYLLELDTVRLSREALELKNFIEGKKFDTVNVNETSELISICNLAINGMILSPLQRSKIPLRYQRREGLLPENFDELISKFSISATGTPREELKEQVINGEIYAEVEFEAP